MGGTSPSVPLRTSIEEKASKPYAWMDSDDEENDEGHGSSAGSPKAAARSNASGSAAEEEEDVDKPPPTAAALEALTFPELLSSSRHLRRCAPQLGSEELTALCQSAARLRFFDGELFQALKDRIRAALRNGELDVGQMTAVATALLELNAYDPAVFGAAAAALLPQIKNLSKGQRLEWIRLLAAAGHKGDDAFQEELRMAPLPMGEATDQFFLCWEFVNSGGFCPRGAACRWSHPKKVKPNSDANT